MIEKNREGALELLEILEAQERGLVFPSFTHADALKLGTILAGLTTDVPKPISIRVFLGDVIVYQYTMEGDSERRFGWTYRKYQLIKKTGHSSMHGKIRALFLNELQDLLEQKEVYGFGCGGFPIQVEGQGIVGAVALSGLPDPADHLYVVKALEEMLGVKVPAIPTEVDEEFVKP